MTGNPESSQASALPEPPAPSATSRAVLVRGASKVPALTVWFWVAKLLTTGMGETTWDWSAIHLGPVPAVVLSGVGFVVAMAWQLWSPRYRAGVYWFAVLMVSVFGTTVADAVHVVLGVPYAVSTIVFGVAVIAAFTLWYRVDGTLSIHSIRTRRRELFYWSAVILTFALGTAAGDLTATTLGWGYAVSIVVFGVLFALPLLARRATAVSAVAWFWVAYVFTRPFGASIADWLGVPPSRGGIGIGTGLVSLVALALLAVVIGYLMVSRVDVEDRQQTPSASEVSVGVASTSRTSPGARRAPQ